eukprot:COSAG02_NODE_2217_length_9480_cov_4.455922_13_plen_154_part_00
MTVVTACVVAQLVDRVARPLPRHSLTGDGRLSVRPGSTFLGTASILARVPRCGVVPSASPPLSYRLFFMERHASFACPLLNDTEQAVERRCQHYIRTVISIPYVQHNRTVRQSNITKTSVHTKYSHLSELYNIGTVNPVDRRWSGSNAAKNAT